MRRSTLLTFFVPLALSACAVYHPRPLTLSQSAAAIRRSSLTDPALRQFLMQHQDAPRHWPKQHWNLGDLTLVGLFDSPTLAIARAHVQARAGALRTARQLPNPKATLFGQHHSLAQSVAQSATAPWTLGVSLAEPILNPDLRRASVAQADYRLQAAQLGAGAAAWSVRQAVREAYIAAVVRSRAAGLARRALALHQEIVALTRARFAVGESGRGAWLAALMSEAQAADRVGALAAQHAAARARLAAALGLSPAALRGVRLSSYSIRSACAVGIPDATAVRSIALLNRLDVRQALLRYEVSEQALRIAIDRQYPEFQVGPGYSWDEGDRRWSLGVSLTLPLFNRNGGAIERARARRQVAALEVRALQEHVLAEVAADEAAYRAARAAGVRATHVAQRSRSELAATRRAFAAGYVGRLVLAQAQLGMVRADRALLGAEVAQVRALGHLEDVLQRPLVGARTPGSTPEEAHCR